MTLVRMLAFRPAGASGAAAGGPPGKPVGAGVGGASPLPTASASAVIRPASAGAIDPVQWPRVIGDLDVTGAARQLATHCALIEHRGATVRLGIDPKVARTPAQVDRLSQALAKYLSLPVVKLEFVEGAGAETPAQSGERRAQEAAQAARKALEEDPTVREMQSRFGATLHPESVRPIE